MARTRCARSRHDPGAPSHTGYPDDRPEEWRKGKDTLAARERPEPPARQDRQARDDGRTWTKGRERPDAQARPTGHRREHEACAQDRDRHPARRTIADRKRDAVADVALYRAVSYTDLSDTPL